jgi:GNAT superfamily N-acetyltransferase
MITYRTATKEDVLQIVALTDQMLAHTKLGTATVHKVHMLVTSPRTLVELAIDNDSGGKIVGFICGVVHESVFNETRRVSDIGLFVLPEYRKGDVAKRLIAHLEKWARDQQASQLWLGQTTGDYPKVVERFYNRLGFKTQGVNCLKEL